MKIYYSHKNINLINELFSSVTKTEDILILKLMEVIYIGFMFISFSGVAAVWRERKMDYTIQQCPLEIV